VSIAVSAESPTKGERRLTASLPIVPSRQGRVVVSFQVVAGNFLLPVQGNGTLSKKKGGQEEEGGRGGVLLGKEKEVAAPDRGMTRGGGGAPPQKKKKKKPWLTIVRGADDSRQKEGEEHEFASED